MAKGLERRGFLYWQGILSWTKRLCLQECCEPCMPGYGLSADMHDWKGNIIFMGTTDIDVKQ